MPETRTIPTQERVLELIPIGRRPYVLAATELSRPDGEQGGWGNIHPAHVSLDGLRRATHALATAHIAGELTPPLPDELASIIVDMSNTAKEAENKCTERWGEKNIADHGARTFYVYSNTAELAIRAAVDHGSTQL